RAATEGPLQAKGDDRQWTESVTAGILGPVGVRELPPHSGERMHAIAVLDDQVDVVVGEAIRNAGRGGGQGQCGNDQRQQPPGTPRHAVMLYLRMCQKAATPSRQLIFLPSA